MVATHVEGPPGTMANELPRFEDGTLGLAMNSRPARWCRRPGISGIEEARLSIARARSSPPCW